MLTNPNIVQADTEQYRNAYPFAHTVVDNFIKDTSILEQILEEFKAFQDWGSDYTEYSKNYQVLKNFHPWDDNSVNFPPTVGTLMSYFNSQEFLSYLEQLTGIKNLLPDPTFTGAGMHSIMRGGRLAVHADYAIHYKTKKYRRINVLLYLNKDWKPEWKGGLQLWEKDMQTLAKDVLPVFNRAVIFDTTATSYHGHPEPLECPEGISRNSLALYYFTEEPPMEYTPGSVGAIWKQTPQERQLSKKPSDVKICMNAMAGNEAATIKRMLESVADYIDYYVFQCNGNDDTENIINQFFKERNIPGFTYKINWEYPGWNRDHTLQAALKADHGCDWILRMDADEQLKVDEDFDWNLLRDTSVQSWNIVADPGNSLYFRTWMWNAKLPWFFQHDKRHETIHLPEIGENFQRVNLPKSFRQVITNDGETWFKPMKFLTDALELELDKVPSNKVLEDNYHLWYIAKSYNDAYGDASQFPFGMDHAREYARRCIFYFSMYLNRQHNYEQTHHPKRHDDMGYYAMMLVAQAYEFLGEDSKALQYYSDAYKFNNSRNEHYLRMAFFFEKKQQYQNMLRITTLITNPERKNPFPTYSFLIENSAYPDTGRLVYDLHEKAKNYVEKYV